MKKQRKLQKLSHVLFKWNFLLVILLNFFIAFGIVVIFFNAVINSISSSRVDLLQQVAERSKIINKAAIALAGRIYSDTSYQLISYAPVRTEPKEGDAFPDGARTDAAPRAQEPDDEQAVSEAALRTSIDQIVSDCNAYFDSIDVELTAAIIMQNGFTYSSKTEKTSDLKSITRNYWYYDNFLNNKTEFWIMRFGDTENRTNCMLSYGRVIRDKDGGYLGIILVNASERTYFKIYSALIDEANDVFIVDENGYAISHSTSDLRGSQILYMPAFNRQYEDQDFKIDIRKNAVTSIYYDPATHWTIVQTSTLSKALGEFYPLLLFLAVMLALLLMVGFSTSMLIARRVSDPLLLLTEKMRKIRSADFEQIDLVDNPKLSDSYAEVYAIIDVYNDMVWQIQALIDKIKADEKEKRKNELDFLQLQINPHFLHNTLLSIKCLIDLRKNEEAASMCASFMHLLRMPIATRSELNPLAQEMDYLHSYVDLMNCRYGGNVHLDEYIEDGVEACLIPRMLLQPIAENSIFHGFGDSHGEWRIEVYAYVQDERLTIRVCDNGVGMSQEQQANIWEPCEDRKRMFSIGLSNVRDRIRSLCGEDYGVTINSTRGEGTEVELSLRVITEEEADEDSDR